MLQVFSKSSLTSSQLGASKPSHGPGISFPVILFIYFEPPLFVPLHRGERLIHSYVCVFLMSACACVFRTPTCLSPVCLLAASGFPAVKAHDAISASVTCWWSFWPRPRLRNMIAVNVVALVCSCPQDGLYTQGKVHIWFSFLSAVGNENHVSFMPDISLALQCVAILCVLEQEESQSAGRKHSFSLSVFTVSGRLLLRWVTAPFSKSQIKQCTGWVLLLIFISHLPLFWPQSFQGKMQVWSIPGASNSAKRLCRPN